MTHRFNRAGSAPKSLLILLVLAVLAIGGLWLARQSRQEDLTLGGPLFPVEPDQIEGLLLTRNGLQFRFDRQDDGNWSLSGAANDYLDRQAMTALLNVLPTAVGGAILPGTVSDDRRYDFNGPDAMRLRVFLRGGQDITLSLGALNPVTGNYFASGAGRQGCFPVAAPFRDKLFMLPITVQAKTLLPPLDRTKVQRLDLTRSGTGHHFERFGGQWWLRLPTTDLSVAFKVFPPLIQQYQARYDDRRRQDEQGLWIMASRQAVTSLIYQVSETVVRDIKSPREAAGRLEQWDLDPPWRQVVIGGPGLNADPQAPVADQFTIGFGPPVGQDQVPAVRRGNVLLTDFQAVNLLDQPLAALVEQFALNEVARFADRLEMTREGTVLLQAVRSGVAETGDGRSAWETVLPEKGTRNLDETARQGLSQDLVVNLNRIEILAVLPPAKDPTVLQNRERVQLKLEWDRSGPTRALNLEVGYLNEDNLPSASGIVADATAGGGPVGLWYPATGKLLQIRGSLLVTARNMAVYVRPDSVH